MKIKKIISGGQTGVDIAALKVAKKMKIETGGWAPPEIQNEAGLIPAFYNLKPTPQEISLGAPNIPRSMRTEWNVRDSDGSLIFLPNKEFNCPGTHLAIQTAQNLGKPVFIIYLNEKTSSLDFHKWINENNIRVLSIGGPSESSYKGMENKTTEILINLLQ